MHKPSWCLVSFHSKLFVEFSSHTTLYKTMAWYGYDNSIVSSPQTGFLVIALSAKAALKTSKLLNEIYF